MSLRSAGLQAALAVSLLAGGCGEVSPADEGGRQILETGEPRFEQQQLTWAHGATVHYGDRELPLEGKADQLAVSDYGFFVEEAFGRETLTSLAERRWVFVDGEDPQELPGDVHEVHVSADGRYAGWIDFDGPLRPAGRVAEVVVVDLEVGEVILTDHSGMGGGFGDDLADRYEELPPEFLGFDLTSAHAYWWDGEGSRRRASLETGEIEDASAPRTDEEFPLPKGITVDAFRGSAANESRSGRSLRLNYGRVSPDGQFAVEISDPSKSVVYQVSPSRRLVVDSGPDRGNYFGGWLPGGRFFMASSPRRVRGYDIDGPDTIAGTLVECSLPDGRCRTVARPPGLRDLVMPGTSSFLG